MFGFRRQATNTGAILVLVALAWASMAIGHTFRTALIIFSVLVWAMALLLFVYLILFRNVKLKLFRDDFDGIVDPLAGSGMDSVPEGTLVELEEGDVLVRGERND